MSLTALCKAERAGTEQNQSILRLHSWLNCGSGHALRRMAWVMHRRQYPPVLGEIRKYALALKLRSSSILRTLLNYESVGFYLATTNGHRVHRVNIAFHLSVA